MTRNVAQNTRPSFCFSGEGSGHENMFRVEGFETELGSGLNQVVKTIFWEPVNLGDLWTAGNQVIKSQKGTVKHTFRWSEILVSNASADDMWFLKRIWGENRGKWEGQQPLRIKSRTRYPTLESTSNFVSNFKCNIRWHFFTSFALVRTTVCVFVSGETLILAV